MCEKRELEVFFDVAGVEWVCQVEYNPLCYPPPELCANNPPYFRRSVVVG